MKQEVHPLPSDIEASVIPYTVDSAGLIHSLYQALTLREGFHPFLQQLVQYIGASSASLTGMHRFSDRIDFFWYHNVPEQFLQLYLEHDMAQSDPIVQTAIRQRGTVDCFQSVIPLLEDFRKDPNYKKFESHFNWNDAAWLAIEGDGDALSLLIIQREFGLQPFSQAELEQLNQLIPFIRQALQLYRRASRQAGFALSMAAVLDALPDATFVLNDAFAVVHSNRSARQMLDEKVFKVEHQRLQLPQVTDQKALLQQVTETIRASMGQQAFISNTLFIKRGDRPKLVVSMTPVEGFDEMRGGALVTVYDPVQRTLPAAAEIAEFFNLTNAEAQLCEDLITGASLKEIAEQRHKSEETLRSYLKQVFCKTGSNRQGQLISTILSALMR